jgi:hypothetical protein
MNFGFALDWRFMRPLFTAALVVSLVGGCAFGPPDAYVAHPAATGGPTIPNPILVRMADRDLMWDQLIDVVDDDFRIEREERVKMAGDVLTEGRIESRPQVSATYLEPQRRDSTGFYNRLESTLQSIRRRVVLRVIPTESGYLVDVAVYKELENVVRPLLAPQGVAAFRTQDRPDQIIDDLEESADVGQPMEQGNWIPEGRDPVQEQVILAKIAERVGQPHRRW